jgi:hypothetical protein
LKIVVTLPNKKVIEKSHRFWGNQKLEDVFNYLADHVRIGPYSMRYALFYVEGHYIGDLSTPLQDPRFESGCTVEVLVKTKEAFLRGQGKTPEKKARKTTANF